MKRILLLFTLSVFGAGHAQVTLDYTSQTGAYNATKTINTNGSYFAGAYNNSASEIGMYANGSGGGYTGDPGVAIFRTFTTAASGNNGMARPMQVGDEFSITCYVNNSTSFFNNSNAGISFNGGTASSVFGDYNALQRAKFQINKKDGGLNGNWFSAASGSGAGYATPGQDVTFKIKLTSAKTVNMTISTVNGATSYDMVLANSPGASNNIQSYVLWNQTSGGGNDMYWENASLKSTGTVEIGNGNGSSVFDGAITDGYIPNSTTIANANTVIKSGTGTITFAANNTYTGSTRINAGTVKLSGAGTLGAGSNVYISNGASLDLNGVDATVASVQETGSNNGGTIALGSATLTITGGWDGTIYQNSISGTGNLVKQGSGTLSLYGAQSFSGAVMVSGGAVATSVPMSAGSYTINGGALTWNAANIIPDGASVNLSSGSLNVNHDETIGNLKITSGTLTIAAGKTLTIIGSFNFSTLAAVVLGEGASIKYGTGATLAYNIAGSYTTGAEWPAVDGPESVVVNGGTLTLSGSRAIAGDVILSGSTLTMGAYLLDRSSTGGTFTLTDGATLVIGGTNGFPANYAAHVIDADSTVEYNGGMQEVTALTNAYGHLILSGTGDKTLMADVTAQGNLTVNNVSLTVTSGQNLIVGGNVANNGGTITFENNANLLQGADSTTNNNTGSVVVRRDSSALYRQDYTMWSSPVAGQVLSVFSPNTLINRFYVYNTATNQYNIVDASSAFGAGTGYLIRMPNGAFLQDNAGLSGTINGTPAAYQQGTATMTFNGKFIGVPNNGTITVPLSAAADGYNFIGNPYPSPISLDAFFTANADAIDGNVWIWRKTNSSPNSAYVTINSAGIYVGNDAPEQEDPSGILRTGQGFIVKVKDGYTTTDVVFTNSMRSTDTANQFFRMNNPQAYTQPENHGVWLNLNGPEGLFSQMYTGYIEGATQGEDAGLDAPYINDKPVVLASVINAKEYTIQARALPFAADDVVPLQFRTDTPGEFTIAIDHVNGVFAQGQSVYLKDNYTNITHNLSDGSYIFSTVQGIFADRFQIVYMPQSALGVSEVADMQNVVVYTQGGNININAGTDEIKQVHVFDTRGRQLYENKNCNTLTMSVQGLYAPQQLLLVHVTTDKGEIIKKIVLNY